MRVALTATLCVATAAGLFAGARTEPASAGENAVDVHGTARQGGRPARDVVIWVDAPDALLNPPAKAVLVQRNLKFYPQVLAVRVGTAVEFPNEDRVFHNVFSFHDGKRFDLGLYPTGTTRRVTFGRAGVSRILCNIHPHMAGYIVAVPSSYFAVSDDAGAFTIPGVPRGRHTYHAWRAGASELEKVVTVDGNTRLEVQWP